MGELAEWTKENIEEIVDILQISPGHIQKTLRMTESEREEYLKEIKTYSVENITDLFNENWKDTGVYYLLWISKSQAAMQKMGLTEEQKATAFYDYEFSEGNETLEWCWPSPPPEHTYDEPPLIKDTPSEPLVKNH